MTSIEEKKWAVGVFAYLVNNLRLKLQCNQDIEGSAIPAPCIMSVKAYVMSVKKTLHSMYVLLFSPSTRF